MPATTAGRRDRGGPGRPFARIVAGLALGLALLQPVGRAAMAQSGEQPAARAVEVTGRGESKWAAREDAIRQALQQVVTQMVIADREVRVDELVRDDVRSTLNGYVERFELLGQEVVGEEHVVKARITVSPTRVAASIGSKRIAPLQAIDGEGIGAAVVAKRLKDSTTAVMIARLLEGFPNQAIHARLRGVKVDVERETVRIQYEMGVAGDFIDQLRAGFEALAESGSAISRCTLRNGWCGASTGYRITLGGDFRGSTWQVSAGAAKLLEPYWDATRVLRQVPVAFLAGTTLFVSADNLMQCTPPALDMAGASNDLLLSSCKLGWEFTVPAELVRDARTILIDPFPEASVEDECDATNRCRVTYAGARWKPVPCEVTATRCFVRDDAARGS